jgi:hypothetical protein
MDQLFFLITPTKKENYQKIFDNFPQYKVVSYDIKEGKENKKLFFEQFETYNYNQAHFIVLEDAFVFLMDIYEEKPEIFASITFSDIYSKTEFHPKSFSKIDIPTFFICGNENKISMETINSCLSFVPCTQFVKLEDSNQESFNFEKWKKHVQSFLTLSSYEPLNQSTKDLDLKIELPSSSVAERLLRLLKLRGIDFIFSNSGTDFTPIIDAYANCDEKEVPEFILAPHENTTISMAHGYALVTRKIQGVMAHVHVGTANAGLGIMNAQRSKTPIFVMAGRSPYYEEGKEGVRSNFVQWGQESFDQGVTFREFTKWDYELKGGHAIDKVVERGIAISTSDPKGPVYM